MIHTDVVIIGSGPIGLFAVHQLGIIGLTSEVIDNLDRAGGQCIELYPDKPIYDIPAIPICTGEELTKNLLEQIKPFKTNFHFNEKVQEISNERNSWIVKTSRDKIFKCSNIIIAGGVGSFEPRKLALENIEKYEGKKIFYFVSNKNKFKDKEVCIFGGGDSALDWAIELSKIAKVNLIHRRSEFRGSKHSLQQVKELEKKNKLKIQTPYQPKKLEEKNDRMILTLQDDKDNLVTVETDYILSFFGLIMKLGPIANWGLNLDNKHIPVNSENFETNKKGIFAIGDIYIYPGKLKLILSGFHEAALAARACFKNAKPNEVYKFQFTTTSKEIHDRLGITKKD